MVNQEATLAAREKQKLIKERFRSWVFTDPDRTERLVRIYNDTYNNLRPRLFDGSHLDFPGMNQTITLRPHQNDAVWRGMSSGNTLLAHAVGAGKTFTMAATGMKMKQAGLIKKPMYVVPNHLLEQFSREFMQLYPNAKLLVAAKEDLTRDRRKFLTAKIASGEWDGIIVTHSSFERIGMSRDYQEKFLLEQIAEYDQLLREHAGAKGRQPQPHQDHREAEGREGRTPEGPARRGQEGRRAGVRRTRRRSRLHRRGALFQEPGDADQDGARRRHPDRRLRAGLRRVHESPLPGRAASPATASRSPPARRFPTRWSRCTRCSDSSTPRGWRSRGLEHFDAWAATFGEVIDTMEISPDGAGLRPRSRFARFTNLPELQQMFRAFSDVQTAEMLNLPRPRLESGKPIVVACPMSEEQHALQQELVERYERLRSQKVDPRVDNALAITTDGRKLATDATDALGHGTGFPGIEGQPAGRERRRHLGADGSDTRHADDLLPTWASIRRPGATRPTTRSSRSWSPTASPASRSPPSATPNPTPRNRPSSRRSGNGSVRVLIGSTQKMGTGTNVQKRLVALHHLDAPWKPAEVEQRDGRILRQGNENEEVAIYRYVTEGSFDAYMWQALETKARFIGQVITGDNAARRAEDIGGQELSYAEVKAIASGNPAVLTLAEADAELQRLTLLKKNHLDEQYVARRSVRDLPATIASLSERLSKLTADEATATAHADDPITIGEPHLLTRGRARRPGRPARRLADERPRDDPRAARHLSRPALRHGPSSAIPARRVSRRRDHPPVHALAGTPGAACRPERPGTPGQRLRLRMRPRPARPRHRRSPSFATTRPASASPSRTTPTCPN